MIRIDIEDTKLETLRKKAGGTFQLQRAFVHTHGRNGEPNRYPEQVQIFPSKNDQGDVVPYPVGQYILSPSTISVDNGRLTLGFVTLDRVKSSSPGK